jgi:hypothetical protein
MIKSIVHLFVALSIFVSPPSLIAQENEKQETGSPLKIDFDLFHSDNNDDINPRIAVEYELDSFLKTNEKHTKRGSYYFYGNAKARLVHAWGSEANNVPSFLEARYGLLWNLSGVETLEELPPIPPEGDNGFVESEPQLEYDYGKIGIVGSLLADTDDGADNTNISGGIVATYAAITAFPDWKVTLPSLLAAIDYVSPQSADVREEVGVGISSFPRFRGAIIWSWDFGAKLDFKNKFSHQLGLLVHYQYVKQFDQEEEWKNKGYDEYDLASFKLLYHFERKNVNKWGLRDVFVGYSTGRQIDYEDDDSRVILGITLQ